MYSLFLLRCSEVTGFLMLVSTLGCKQLSPQSSDTQGSGLSVGRMEFRDPRSMPVQQTRNTGLPSAPASVKGQVPGRQNMNSMSSAMSSPASGSLSASEYAQSLNQYAKGRSSGRVQGSVFNHGQMLPKSKILTDVDRAQLLAEWNAMGRDAVSTELQFLKIALEYAHRGDPEPLSVTSGPPLRRSVAQFVRFVMRDPDRRTESVDAEMIYLVTAYNLSHPDQPPVNY